MAGWDPGLYGRFSAERARPVDDLIARLPRQDYSKIVDLGCGSGQSTRPLQQRFTHAKVAGIDNSPAMIKAARESLPGIAFAVGDIAQWGDESVDLVFSNAALHWVDDHIGVMGRVAAGLPPGGCIAAQFPDNLDERSHALMREVAAAPQFRAKLAAVADERQQIGAYSAYEAALAPHCSHIDIWRTTYVHRLEGPDAIVAWVEGAGLRPFLAPLEADEKAEYLALYREAIAKAYPREPSGRVLLPFPRLFVVGAR